MQLQRLHRQRQLIATTLKIFLGVLTSTPTEEVTSAELRDEYHIACGGRPRTRQLA
jgi:hypothetical protein